MGHQRKLKSYEVEINFYKNHTKRIIQNNEYKENMKCEIPTNFGLKQILDKK